MARSAAGRSRALAGRPGRGASPGRAASRHGGGPAGCPAGRRPRRRGRRRRPRRHRHAQRAPLVAAGHGALPRRSAVRGARHRPPGPTDAAGGAGSRPWPGADRAGAGDPPARAGPAAPAAGGRRGARPLPVEGPARLRPGRLGLVLRSRRGGAGLPPCAARLPTARRGRPVRVRQVVDGARGAGPRPGRGGRHRDGADARQRPCLVPGRRRRVLPPVPGPGRRPARGALHGRTPRRSRQRLPRQAGRRWHSPAIASSPSCARTRSAGSPPRPGWPGWWSAGCTS